MAGVTVISARAGFWRCGRQWTGVTELAAGELTPAQLAALRADPNFTVAETADAEPPAEPAPPKPARKG